jgi:hypothetical protein
VVVMLAGGGADREGPPAAGAGRPVGELVEAVETDAHDGDLRAPLLYERE